MLLSIRKYFFIIDISLQIVDGMNNASETGTSFGYRRNFPKRLYVEYVLVYHSDLKAITDIDVSNYLFRRQVKVACFFLKNPRVLLDLNMTVDKLL